ncbi:MAG: DUF5915 domain-containing protein, partial [Candidatus Bathyarchaeia archaeon]
AERAMMAAQGVLAAAARARMRAGIKLRQPLRSMAVAAGSEELRDSLRLAERILLEQGNVQSLRLLEREGEVGVGWVSEPFDGGAVLLDIRLTEKELAEGLARDLVRRLQQMRKEMDLRVDDYVDVWISAPGDKVGVIRGEGEYIRQEVRVKDLRIIAGGRVEAQYVKDWDIGGEKYTMGISLAGGSAQR